MTISDLHCGHSIFDGLPCRLFRFGPSRSATQSSKQLSWARSAQGHGDRQAEDVGVSSVSSEKQIQHFRGSSEGLGWGWEGLSRRTVCESSEMADFGEFEVWLDCLTGLARPGDEGL